MNPLYSAIALVLLAMLSIQYGASFAKSIFTSAGLASSGPTVVSMLRLYTAAFVLAMIWKPWRARLDRAVWKPLIGYGLSLGLMNIFFYWSLARIPLGLAVSLEFIGPLSVVLLRSRKPIDFVWLFLAVAGLALILPLKQDYDSLDSLGVLYALLAGAFWALYIIFGEKVSHHQNFGAITSTGMLIAALAITPFCLTEVSKIDWSYNLLISGFFVGILSSALPYSLEMKAMKNIPQHLFGLLMSLEPVVAAMMGLINLQEKLTNIQWAAIGLIVLASAGGTLTARKARTT